VKWRFTEAPNSSLDKDLTRDYTGGKSSSWLYKYETMMKLNTTIASILIIFVSLLVAFITIDFGFLLRAGVICLAVFGATMLGMKLERNLLNEKQ
jgi:4-hydroxybenzoate polyprenyltransferase